MARKEEGGQDGDPDQKNEIKRGNVLDYEITPEPLKEFPVKFFKLPARQLLALVLANIEFFKTSAPGFWFCSCVSGMSRSVAINGLFSELGIPIAQRENARPSEQGITFFELIAMIAEGKIEEKGIKFHILDQAIDKLGVFYTPLPENRVIELIQNGLIQHKQDLQRLNKFSVFIMDDEEHIVSNLVERIKEQIHKGDNFLMIAQSLVGDSNFDYQNLSAF